MSEEPTMWSPGELLDQGDELPALETSGPLPFNIKMILPHNPWMCIQTRFGWIEGISEEIWAKVREIELGDELLEKTGDPYIQSLVLTSDDRSNGYALENCNRPIMIKNLYLDLVKMWFEGSKETMDFKTFYRKCNEEFCTDWNKQDEHGECYGGFYKSEDEKERENAWYLTLNKNILELYRLPWPKLLLIYTVELSCGNRTESVARSNFICEWVYQKYQQLNGQDLPKVNGILPDDFDEKEYLWNGID